MADMPDDKIDAPEAMPSLSIDWELYGEYLADSDLTDDEKRDFIETLWNIVVSFVDLGFGVHPVQQACAENQDTGIFSVDDMLSLIQDIPTIQTHTNTADGHPNHAETQEES